MTPDPAPYGADLPRPPSEGVWFFSARESNEYARALYAALDAANAEVLALREVVEAVRRRAAKTIAEAEKHGNSATLYMLAEEAARVLYLLPAPTGDDG